LALLRTMNKYYWAEPRGSISRDGQYVVFDSNFDISSTGLTDYSDVYLSHVAAPSAQLSAAPGTLAFGSVLVGNTSALSGNLTASNGSATVNSATVAGSGYSLSGLTLPLTLAAGQSATFTVDFTPTVNKFRLFHTRSRSSEYYWSIPRGAISRDGRYVVFDSNFDISNTGLTDYTDVYISKTH
jgi:hypothetical protein